MSLRNLPHIPLNDGTSIPQLGLGTYQLKGDDAYRVTLRALELGYRHLDTAKIYENEAEVGRAIADSGVARDDLFVTTKMWPSDYEAPKQAIETSLEQLGLEHVDLYLLHWPVPMFGTAGAAWEAMTEIRDAGQATSVGVSNFEIDHLQQIITDSGVVPAINQIELHPLHQRRALREFCAQQGIAIEAWSPIARGQAQLFESEPVRRAAATHGASAAQVVLRWHLQQDIIVFPKTATPARLEENAGVLDFQLSDEEMAAITALEVPDGAGALGPIPQIFRAGL